MAETDNTPIKMNDRSAEHLLSAEITDINWERIIIHMTVHVDYGTYPAGRPLRFFMVTGFYKANAVFDAEQTEHGIWHLKLNLTNPGYCFCLPTGNYSVVLCDGDDILCTVLVSEALAPKLSEKSRFFIHNGETVAYCVNLSLDDNEEALIPKFYIQDTKRGRLKVFNPFERQEQVSISGKIYKNVRHVLLPFVKKLVQLIYNFYRRFYSSKSRKTVLFMSEQNEKMKFNLTAVYERMRERGLDRQFEIMQSFRAYVSRTPWQYGFGSWLSVIRKLAKADYIFVDDHCPVLDWLILDKETVLTQLWHAGAGYKAVGYSRWGHTGGAPSFSCHRQYRYGITPGSNIAHFFSEQFGINESQILPTGMPRMDSYLDPEYRENKTRELFEQFPVCRGRKVILFAPTFRGKDRSKAFYPYEKIDFDRLYRFCGDEYVVLFKMHPWVPDAVPIRDEHKDRFLDVGTYPNINDLFYITDLFISDYSSGIFEYALMGKPAMFFAFDEHQVAYVRGFHRDYQSSTPGKVCHTFDELIRAMETEDYEFYRMKEYVDYHYDHPDTHASDRVIDWILLDQMPEDIRKRVHADKEKVAMLRRLDFGSMKQTKNRAESEA